MSYPVPATSYAPQEPDSTAHTVVAWICCVFTAFYMLPWAIAATRHTKNAPGIALLNLFLGWSGVGWIGSLIWACTDRHKNDVPAQLVIMQPTTVVTPGWQPQPQALPQHYSQYPNPQYPNQQYPELPPVPYQDQPEETLPLPEQHWDHRG